MIGVCFVLLFAFILESRFSSCACHNRSISLMFCFEVSSYSHLAGVQSVHRTTPIYIQSPVYRGVRAIVSWFSCSWRNYRTSAHSTTSSAHPLASLQLLQSYFICAKYIHLFRGVSESFARHVLKGSRIPYSLM